MGTTNPDLVELRDLKVAFDGVQVLHGIDLTVARGEALGLVGESGCGKSVTWLAALGLLPGKAAVTGSIRVDGRQLCGAERSDLEEVRGGRIAMIFQDPSSSLNPVLRIGRQIVEALQIHRGLRPSGPHRGTPVAGHGWNPRCPTALRSLSARIFRWTVSAPDDRDGARG